MDVSGAIWEQYQGSQQGTVLGNHRLPWFLGPTEVQAELPLPEALVFSPGE